MADERGVDVVVSGPDHLPVLATHDRLSQVLGNLLADAIETSPPDSTVASRSRSRTGGPTCT